MPKKATLVSLLLHIAAMALCFWIGYSIPPLTRNITPDHFVPVLTRFILSPQPGGGGAHSQDNPRRGRLPARPMRRVFSPTMPQIENPKLPLEVAILDAPDQTVAVSEIGDPLSRFPSGKTGHEGWLGNGPGKSDGFGAYGNGPGGPGGFSSRTIQPKITRQPRAIFHPEPDYSEEARKARFQGVVILTVIVGKDGVPSGIRVMRGAGLGLDEKAMEAVTRWRFIPAMADGQIVETQAIVEVSFHLL